MSGIYIPEAKIPDGDYVRVLMLHKDGTCIDGIGNIFKAIPVPDHGRLVDGDKIVEECKDKEGRYVSQFAAAVGETVESAPTIIPASKE